MHFATQDVAYAIVRFFAKAKYYLSRKDRENVKANLRRIMPEAGEKEISLAAREVFVNFAKYLADFFSLPEEQKDYLKRVVKCVGTENITEAIKAGKGCVLMTGHFGNWELGGCALSNLGFKINVVILEHRDPRINNLFVEQRRRAGMNIIPTGSANEGCKEALRRNEIIGILGDRPYGDRGIEVDFFGKKAVVPRGAALFSLRYGAPIIPLFVYKDDTRKNSYNMVIEKPFLINSENHFSDQLKKATREFLNRFEQHIRKYPSQWYMFNRVWGDD